MKYGISLSAGVLLSCFGAHADPVTKIGALELIQSPSQSNLPISGDFTTDAPFSTLNQSINQSTWYSAWWGTARYTGNTNSPFSSLAEQHCRRDLFPNDPTLQTGKILVYIDNFYSVGNGALLGFLHMEDGTECINADPTDYPPPYTEGATCPPKFPFPGTNVGAFYCGSYNTKPAVRYYIGLAYSTNGGTSWKYLGNIIAPKANGGAGTNIGGVPYLVKDGYFYVYFNEHALVGSNLQTRISVARAPVASVITAAQSGSATQWKKYDANLAQNQGFNQDALTGEAGANIVPEFSMYPFAGTPANVCPAGTTAPLDQCQVTNATYQDLYDTHSDAVYSRSVNKYFLLVNVVKYATILYSSPDAVTWGNPVLVDNTSNYTGADGVRHDGLIHHAFTSIMAASSNTEDTREAGRLFYVVYPLKDSKSYVDYGIFRKKVTVSDDVTHAVLQKLQ